MEDDLGWKMTFIGRRLLIKRFRDCALPYTAVAVIFFVDMYLLRVLFYAACVNQSWNINYGYPKLTGILPSKTCIGWKYPVSKTFLPKTKFSLSIFPKKLHDDSAVCYLNSNTVN